MKSFILSVFRASFWNLAWTQLWDKKIKTTTFYSEIQFRFGWHVMSVTLLAKFWSHVKTTYQELYVPRHSLQTIWKQLQLVALVSFFPMNIYFVSKIQFLTPEMLHLKILKLNDLCDKSLFRYCVWQLLVLLWNKNGKVIHLKIVIKSTCTN